MLFKKLSVIILIGLLFGFAVSSSTKADTLILTGVNGNTDLTGTAYISPYYATLNASNISIYCIDPLHPAALGQSFNVNVSQLTGALDPNTYLGSAGLNTYKEIAYLLFSTGVSGTNYLSLLASGEAAKIQAAVWYLAANAQGKTTSYDQNNSYVTSAITALGASFYGMDFSNIYIISGDPKTSQEFMTVRVPEPTTILLLGAGILGIGIFARRKKKEKESA